jgi:hypothetical protein
MIDEYIREKNLALLMIRTDSLGGRITAVTYASALITIAQ